MKCLVDEALPRSLAKALKAAQIDAVDARDVGLGGKSDPEVLAQAVSDGRSLITKDLDFTDPRRFPPEGHFGILVVRFPDTVSKATLVQMVIDAVKTLKDDDVARNIVILEPTNIRFWRK
jgi:predicted nuclease of predicted toxin-antitoxin system